MPLKLSLKPHERFVLNGASRSERRPPWGPAATEQGVRPVMAKRTSCSRRRRIPPSRRIYFPVMMMYLDDSSATGYHEEFVRRLQEFMGAINNPNVLAECVNISKLVLQVEYYKALTSCRKLMEYEDQRLGNVAPSVPAGGQAGFEQPRDAEYRLFGEVTRALMSAAELPSDDFRGTHRRARLEPACLDGAGVRLLAPDQSAGTRNCAAQIISLSLWVGRHSSAVMRGEETSSSR